MSVRTLWRHIEASKVVTFYDRIFCVGGCIGMYCAVSYMFCWVFIQFHWIAFQANTIWWANIQFVLFIYTGCRGIMTSFPGSRSVIPLQLQSVVIGTKIMVSETETRILTDHIWNWKPSCSFCLCLHLKTRLWRKRKKMRNRVCANEAPLVYRRRLCELDYLWGIEGNF